jgi:hypothetical protein
VVDFPGERCYSKSTQRTPALPYKSFPHFSPAIGKILYQETFHMSIPMINRLGDWNPQLLRELKGRLKFRNVALVASLSLLGQLLLVISFVRQLPVAPPMGEHLYSTSHRYCTGTPPEYYDSYPCVRDPFGNFAINWAHWWLDVFVWLSIIGMFAILVAGTYMLIGDQDTEDRRGTLNFIRLSPRSAATILLGKLLGVPVLLYLAGILAIPLHWWAGIAAQIPPGWIVSYYGVLLASCFCFYSAALLFGTVSSWLGGFQPWLGSGTLLFLLWLAIIKEKLQNASDLLNLLSPSTTLASVIWAMDSPDRFDLFRSLSFDNVQWFQLPVGKSVGGTVALSLLIYGFLTYWIWQALLRRFPNPGATLLSKRQSYLLVAGYEILILGFALQQTGEQYDFVSLSLLNLLLFLGIIVALTPDRQALHDWARYRHANLPARKGFWHNSLVRDLVWGDKSPALVAVAINLASATAVLVPWALCWKYAFPSLILAMNFILIYAALAQLMLFVKTQKPAVWAVGSVAAAALLPPIIFNLLSARPDYQPAVWLFSAFPAFWSWEALKEAPAATVFAVFVAQWLVLLLLSVQLTRKLRKAGESASKALLAGKQ